MKRSTAVDKLTDFLETSTDWKTDNGSFYGDAEKILTFLEHELGMNPQSYTKTESCGCCTNCYEDQWEPED